VEDFVESRREEVGVGIGEDERGAKLDDIVMGAIGAGKDATVVEAIDDVGGLLLGCCAGGAVGNEIDAEEKTGAAHVADERVVFLQFTEHGEPASADSQGVVLKIFVTQHVEDGESRGTGNRIATKSAEEFHAVIEGSSDFRRGDDRGKWEGIADGFPEDDDIGNDALRFETPEMRAEACETDLHFIGDANAARGTNVLVDFGQIVGRENDLAPDAGERLRNVGRDGAVFLFQLFQNLYNV